MGSPSPSHSPTVSINATLAPSRILYVGYESIADLEESCRCEHSRPLQRPLGAVVVVPAPGHRPQPTPSAFADQQGDRRRSDAFPSEALDGVHADAGDAIGETALFEETKPDWLLAPQRYVHLPRFNAP